MKELCFEKKKYPVLSVVEQSVEQTLCHLQWYMIDLLSLSLSLIQAPCRSWIRPGGSWNRVERTSPTRLSPHPCAVRHAPPCWLGNTPTTTTPTPTTRTALHPPGRPNMSRAPLEFTSTAQATGQVETTNTHWKDYFDKLLSYCCMIYSKVEWNTVV